VTRGTIPPPQRQLTRVILRQPRPVNYPPRLSLCLLSHRGGFGFGAGQLVTVQTLVKLGAPLDALDHGRATPLHSAAGKGHVKVLRVLREMGGNLFARADCGRTALHTAAAYGQRDAVRAPPCLPLPARRVLRKCHYFPMRGESASSTEEPGGGRSVVGPSLTLGGRCPEAAALPLWGGNALLACAKCNTPCAVPKARLHTAAAYGQRDAVRASPPILSCTGAGMPLQHEGETRNRQARAFHARPLGRC
jgi:hypothetical protein